MRLPENLRIAGRSDGESLAIWLILMLTLASFIVALVAASSSTSGGI